MNSEIISNKLACIIEAKTSESIADSSINNSLNNNSNSFVPNVDINKQLCQSNADANNNDYETAYIKNSNGVHNDTSNNATTNNAITIDSNSITTDFNTYSNTYNSDNIDSNNDISANKYTPVLSKRKQVRLEMEQRKKWNTPRSLENNILNKTDSGILPSDDTNIEDIESLNDSKIPKKFFGLMFGYCGINYQGLQINPNSNTIEKALEEAIFKAGGLIPTNRDFSRCHWTRSCRTDKGVHAAANVVSLKMNVMEDIENKINSNLPADIRIFKCIRVTKSFSGYRYCSERRYEYIIPSYCFQNMYH